MANQYGSSRSSRDENSVPANYQPRSRRERRELEERLVYEEQEQSYIEPQEDPEGEYTDYAYEDEQDLYEPEEYDASEYMEYPEYEEEPVDSRKPHLNMTIILPNMMVMMRQNIRKT
jgi:signal peptidase I lepB